MAMSFFEARLAPMPKPYLTLEEYHQDQRASVRTLMKRSHSFSGFVPYARLFGAPCQVADLTPSTAASQNSLRSEQPDFGEESVASHWPDTEEELVLPSNQASTATSHDDGECSCYDDQSNCGDEPEPRRWPGTDEEMALGTKPSWPDTDEELDSPVCHTGRAFEDKLDADSRSPHMKPGNSFEDRSDFGRESVQNHTWPDTDEDVLCPDNRIRTVRAFGATSAPRLCQAGTSSNASRADVAPHVELDVTSCGISGSPTRQVPVNLNVAMKTAPEDSVVMRRSLQLRKRVSLEAALLGTTSSPMTKSPSGPPAAPRAIALAEELVGTSSILMPTTAPRAQTLPGALIQCLSTAPPPQGEGGHSAACAAALPKGSPVGAGLHFFPNEAENDQILADDESRPRPPPHTCVTTMVIKGLPKDVSQKELLEELNASGFAGSYDFCYMPGNFKSYENKGYAFVNFISVEVVRKFLDAWNDKARFSNMPLAVSPAEVQGLEANLKKWNRPRMARIRNPNLKPFVLEQKLENCLTRNCPPAPVKLNLDAALQSAGGRILQPDGRKQGGRAGNNGVPEVAASGHQDLSVGSQASFVVPSPLCIPLEAVKMCTQEPSLTNARAMLPATSSVAMTPGSSPKDAPAPVAFGAQALSKGWPSADVPKALSRQLPTLLIRGGTSDKPMRTSSACAAYAFGLQAA
eukprot:TRINITY_DN13082_c0_g1_i2.p1 TRINITY_DN13082_c0_g1~~TRINITY_DN13082_c0_g1_i2.p1  ORF type:complete len:691 (+),score=113.85 TRINITY_DN13082_c0_g1_i2:52-2124(+)